MKNNKGFAPVLIALIVAGALIVGGGVYWLGKNKGENKKVVENPITKNQNLNVDVYPLYSNLSWNEEVALTDNYWGSEFSGFKVTSKNITDKEYYSFNESFINYYDKKLTSLGWYRDPQYQADGAGSQVIGYTKGDEIIVLDYDSKEIKQIPNEPLSCPCNMTFSIFSGKKNINEVKDNKEKLMIYESKTYGYTIGYSGIESKYINIDNDGKKIMFFPNQSDIDNLEIVDSSYVVANYISLKGTVTFGVNQYKKYKDNITPRHTYYLKSGLKNNKSIFISIEGDSDNPNYIDLSSLKIDGSSLSNLEESSTEVFNYTSGAVKSIKLDGTNEWILAVDLLSNNPKWIPGVDDRWFNQNTKIRNLIVTKNTKTYTCGSNGSSDIPQEISIYMAEMQNEISKNISDFKRIPRDEFMTDYLLRAFDINGSDIIAIYKICLP